MLSVFSTPSVPEGKARIRVQISAAHTQQELETGTVLLLPMLGVNWVLFKFSAFLCAQTHISCASR